MSAWLEYCAAGLRQMLERVWLRIQTLQVKSADKLVLRPRQEQLLHLLRDHGGMTPADIWKALDISRQGAMDLLRPLLDAGVVEKVGGNKTGRYILRNS
jgi:DNA-binding MarR family transcriptional regulator